MAFKVLDTRCLLLIFLLVSKAGETAGSPSGNREHSHCISKEYYDMAWCCTRTNDARESSQHNTELIGSLETRLTRVESSVRENLANASKQFSLKSSETPIVFTSSLEGYTERLKVAEQKVESLRSENNNHNASISQIHTRLDTIMEELESAKGLEKAFTQILKDKLTDSSTRLMKEVSTTKTRLGLLRESLNELEKNMTEMNSAMLKTEPDLRAFVNVIDNLCWPPFAWQGDGCYYIPFLKKSWQQARSFCKALSADLVVPRDYLLFVKWLRSLDFDDDVWVGASDIGQEDKWVWIHGKPLDIKPTEFINWKNPSKKEKEDCLEICSHAGYRPSDMRCEDENYFICQKSAGTF